jgi:hypothetical protein
MGKGRWIGPWRASGHGENSCASGTFTKAVGLEQQLGEKAVPPLASGGFVGVMR